MNFEQYKRTSIVEVRKVTQEEINTFHNNVNKSIHAMNEFFYNRNFIEQQVLSLTDKQIEHGCPKLGDVIVRNINDSWDVSYVSEEEFNNTFTKYK